jgi:GDP-mannose 6-dehydrogenase
MIEKLMKLGKQVRVYDPNVDVSRLIGANKHYADLHIHGLAEIMVKSADEIIEFAECVVIGHGTEEFAEAAKTVRDHQFLIDLVRIDASRKSSGNYSGLCW